MKRSEFVRQEARRYNVSGVEDPDARNLSEAHADAAERAGVTWDPEKPEGFREWFKRWDTDGGPVPDLEGAALAGWNACFARRGGLTYKEIERACANFGISLECGGCASIFYTGVDDCPHDSSCTHQEAQQRTIEPKVDPEVRRKEIAAQIASYRSQAHTLINRLFNDVEDLLPGVL